MEGDFEAGTRFAAVKLSSIEMLGSVGLDSGSDGSGSWLVRPAASATAAAATAAAAEEIAVSAGCAHNVVGKGVDAGPAVENVFASCCEPGPLCDETGDRRSSDSSSSSDASSSSAPRGGVGRGRGEDRPVIHGATVASPARSEVAVGLVDCAGAGASSSVAAAPSVSLECFKRSVRLNRILCIGAGYVGGPTMAVVAEQCPDVQVFVADKSAERITAWNSDKLPIYEPGLEEIVKAQRGRNLFFTTDVAGSIRDCDVIFIAVNTPTKRYGIGKGKAADISACEAVARSIAEHARSPKIIVEKSTVPIRTADSLRRVLHSNRAHDGVAFTILSNPEFLAEGTAVADLHKPDRVLVGGNTDCEIGSFALQAVAAIYRRWVPADRVLLTNTWSSEMSKLVANAFLAQRVSSINSIAMLCEKTGADVREVSRAIGADSRIGGKFLSASIGFGGSCLEKDTRSLAYLCDFFGLREAAHYWQMVNDMNDMQKTRFAQRVLHGLFDTVNRKRIAIFGFAFKKNTSDVRSTPALDICASLMADGAQLQVYDPKVELHEALGEFRTHGTDRRADVNLEKQFHMVGSPLEAVRDSHAIVILTEWDEFRTYDYAHFFSVMQKPAFIFDGRNLLDHRALFKLGFEVHGIGAVPMKQRGPAAAASAASFQTVTTSPGSNL